MLWHPRPDIFIFIFYKKKFRTTLGRPFVITYVYSGYSNTGGLNSWNIWILDFTSPLNIAGRSLIQPEVVLSQSSWEDDSDKPLNMEIKDSDKF